MDCPTKLARQNYSFPPITVTYSLMAYFDYESARGWLSPDRMLRFDPMKLTVSSKRLPLVRLDDCGLQPDFSTDVQGLEYRVIAGGLQTIRTYRPVIMAESIHWRSDAHRIVQPLDYCLMEFDGRSFVEVGRFDE